MEGMPSRGGPPERISDTGTLAPSSSKPFLTFAEETVGSKMTDKLRIANRRLLNAI
jgi:hypothetical protein